MPFYDEKGTIIKDQQEQQPTSGGTFYDEKGNALDIPRDPLARALTAQPPEPQVQPEPTGYWAGVKKNYDVLKEGAKAVPHTLLEGVKAVPTIVEYLGKMGQGYQGQAPDYGYTDSLPEVQGQKPLPQAQVFEEDPITKGARDARKKIEHWQEPFKPDIGGIGEIKSAYDFAKWATSNISKAATQIVETMLPWGLLGKGKKAVDVATKAPEAVSATGKVLKYVADWAKFKPMDIPIGALELGQTMGGQLEDLEKGKTKELSPIRAIAGALIATKLEELGTEKLFAKYLKMGPEMERFAAQSLLKRAAQGSLTAGVGEGAEEFFQSYAEQFGIDPSDLFSKKQFLDALEGAAAGAIGGFALGGLGGAVTRRRKGEETKEATTELSPEATAILGSLKSQLDGGKISQEDATLLKDSLEAKFPGIGIKIDELLGGAEQPTEGEPKKAEGPIESGPSPFGYSSKEEGTPGESPLDTIHNALKQGEDVPEILVDEYVKSGGTIPAGRYDLASKYPDALMEEGEGLQQSITNSIEKQKQNPVDVYRATTERMIQQVPSTEDLKGLDANTTSGLIADLERRQANLERIVKPGVNGTAAANLQAVYGLLELLHGNKMGSTGGRVVKGAGLVRDAAIDKRVDQFAGNFPQQAPVGTPRGYATGRPTGNRGTVTSSITPIQEASNEGQETQGTEGLLNVPTDITPASLPGVGQVTGVPSMTPPARMPSAGQVTEQVPTDIAPARMPGVETNLNVPTDIAPSTLPQETTLDSNAGESIGEGEKVPQSESQAQEVTYSQATEQPKQNQWVGEIRDADDNYLGNIYKTGENEWRIYKGQAETYGTATEVSSPLTKDQFKKIREEQISVGGQTVRVYQLQAPGQTVEQPSAIAVGDTVSYKTLKGERVSGTVQKVTDNLVWVKTKDGRVYTPSIRAVTKETKVPENITFTKGDKVTFTNSSGEVIPGTVSKDYDGQGRVSIIGENGRTFTPVIERVTKAKEAAKAPEATGEATREATGEPERVVGGTGHKTVSPNVESEPKSETHSGYGKNNKIFTEERANKAREILRKKLSQLNVGIDPEILAAGIDLAGYHIEAGARKFADYAAKMIEDLGEQIKPYLKSFYLAVRNYPGFENEDMETEAELEEATEKAEKEEEPEKVTSEEEPPEAESEKVEVVGGADKAKRKRRTKEEIEADNAEKEEKGPFRKGLTTSSDLEGLDIPVAKVPIYSVGQVKQFLAFPLSRWKAIGNVEVVRSVDDLPARLTKNVKRGDLILGAYDPPTDTTYIVADHVAHKQAAMKILIHEVIGHRGVKSLFDIFSWKNATRRVAKAYEGTKIMDRIVKTYNLDMTNDYDRETAASELIAYMAEKRDNIPLLTRVYGAIRGFLRRVFPNMKWTDNDIYHLISKAQRISSDVHVKPSTGTYFKKGDDAFGKWFGKSKVVDKEGNPLVVYHGTRAQFEAFSPEEGEEAHFFTDNKKSAQGYARSSAAEGKPRVVPVYLSLQNPKILDYKESQDNEIWEDIEEAQEEGYDGLIALNSDDGRDIINQYVAFKPSQIKSVDNKGTWNPKDERILFKKSLETDAADKLIQDLLAEIKKQPEFKEATSKLASNKIEDTVKESKGLWKTFHDRFGKPYENKDYSIFDRAFNLPYWIAKKYDSMKRHVDAEMRAKERREKMLFDWYEGGLRDAQDAIMKAGKEKEFQELVWKWDGRKFPKGTVTEGRFQGSFDDGSIALNPKHSEQIRAFLLSEGVSQEVADGYVEVRKVLDGVLLEYWKIMKEYNVSDNDIQEYRKQIGNIPNYFPHVREGNTFVAIYDKAGETVYREHFDRVKEQYLTKTENKAPARARAWLEAKIKAGNLKGTINDYRIEGPKKVAELPDEVFFQIPVEAMDQILDVAAGKVQKETGADLKKALARAVADTLKSRGWARHAIARKGTPGFKQDDVFGTLFDHLSGFAGFKTKMERAKEHSEILKSVDAKERPEEYTYNSQYVKDVLANQDRLDRVVDGLRGIFFAKYLGAVVKSGIVNLTQNMALAAPVLSVHTKHAEAKLGKAMVDVRKALTSKAAWTQKEVKYENLSNDEQWAIHQLHESGDTIDAYLRELAGELPGAGIAKHMHKVLSRAGIFMGLAEKFNRTSTGLAAFRVGVNEKKMNKDDALAFAREIIYDSHFLLGKSNLPEIMRGGKIQKILRTGYTFRTFSHNFVLCLQNLFMNQGKQGKYAVLRSMRNLFLMGGITAVPMGEMIMKAIMTVLGDDDDDTLTKLRSWMPWNWLKDMVVYGLPGLAGVDISGSLSMEVPTSWGDIIGVPYAILEDTGNMMKSYQSGQTLRALSETPLTPIFVRNAIQAYTSATVGQHTRSGKPINYFGEVGPRKISTGEAIMKGAFGFQSVSSSNAYRAYEASRGMEETVQGVKSRYADQYTNALVQGDVEEMRNILQSVVKWNMDHANQPHMAIDLTDSVKSRLRQGTEVPKQMRGKALEITGEWIGNVR